VSTTETHIAPATLDGGHPVGGLTEFERLRLLESAVVHSYDSIMITDTGSESNPSPRIIYVNDAFSRLSGYQPEEVVGRSPSILQGPESDKAEIGRMRAALGREEAFTAELINYRKDGTTFHVEARIMPIRDQGGSVTHWVGVQRDVSERKRAEAERTRLDSRLRETQKLESLGVLAGGIAHDFNNLLTVVLGNVALTRSSESREAAERHLQLIESSALRAADLCRQMLAYSGQGRYMVQPVDLNSVIRDTADLVRSSMPKNLTLTLDLTPDLSSVLADAGQMQQVVMNVVVNAIEAIGAVVGEVRVLTREAACEHAQLSRTYLGPDLPAGDYVVLEVSDNGGGIPREIISRIFDPFFTTKFVGRGLGLAAVLGIVRSHRGAIEVESEPGHRTVFRLYFPAFRQPVPDRPAAPPVVDRGRPARTLLVVDDERLLRETIAAMLEARGYSVLTAADGLEAVEIYQRQRERIDAVVLDLSMPRLDGAGAFAEMRRMDPQVRVLLMSGFSETEAVQRFAISGLASFVQKPFSSQVLITKLDAVLGVAPG
jgi:two-component system cell cycle sensor histidine kinase/response regulator CckA